MCTYSVWLFFFFQAEDGIRDRNVTGVQTCALPILHPSPEEVPGRPHLRGRDISLREHAPTEQHGDFLGVDLVVFGLATVDCFHRSEERRVGKECRSWWCADGERIKVRTEHGGVRVA